MKSHVSVFHAALLEVMKHAEFMQILHRDYVTYIQALLSFFHTCIKVVKPFLSAYGLRNKIAG
jgi:hypothetical protein